MKNNNYLDTETKRIEVENNKIIYTLKCNNSKHYFTYNATLYDLFCLKYLIPFTNKNGRLRFNIQKEKLKIYAYDLAFSCYNNRINFNTYIEDFKKFQKYKTDNKLVIDHIDNYVNNNTKLNLLLMSNTLNASKADLVTRVKTPCKLLCCNNNGKILIKYSELVTKTNMIIGDVNVNLYNNNKPMISGDCNMLINTCVICENTEDFVACLHEVVKREIKYKGVTITYPIKINNTWKTEREKLNLANAIYAIYEQEELAISDTSEYTVWKKYIETIDNI